MTSDERSHRRALFGIVDQGPHDPVGRQLHQLDHRRAVEVRVGVKGPMCVRRDSVGVRPRRVGRRHARGGLFPVEPSAIEIPLGRVIGRCDVVEPPAGLVQARDLDDVEIAGRDVRDALAVAAHPIDVLPAVAFARPEEAGSLREPRDLIHDVDPGAVALGEDGPRGSRRGVGQHDAVGVLEPVHALQDQLVRSRPFHTWEVVLAGVVGDLEPGRGAATSAHDAGGYCRVLGPGLGILNGSDFRIERVGVVDEVIRSESGHVEPPVRDLRPIG